jgi:hypothetical protein
MSEPGSSETFPFFPPDSLCERICDTQMSTRLQSALGNAEILRG